MGGRGCSAQRWHSCFSPSSPGCNSRILYNFSLEFFYVVGIYWWGWVKWTEAWKCQMNPSSIGEWRASTTKKMKLEDNRSAGWRGISPQFIFDKKFIANAYLLKDSHPRSSIWLLATISGNFRPISSETFPSKDPSIGSPTWRKSEPGIEPTDTWPSEPAWYQVCQCGSEIHCGSVL